MTKRWESPHEQKLLRLHERSGLEAIEVDAAGEIRGVELDFVIASVDVIVHEFGDPLTEGVVDGRGERESDEGDRSGWWSLG